MDDSAASGWESIRRRLEANRAALQSSFEPSAEEKDQSLKNRAVELSRESQAEPEEQIEVVEFLLAHEKYGIEPDYLREIFPLKTLTPIPCTPPFVLGVTNLRGEVLSVIDLKKFFELPDKGLTDFTKVIVLESETMAFGILADSVTGEGAERGHQEAACAARKDRDKAGGGRSVEGGESRKEDE